MKSIISVFQFEFQFGKCDLILAATLATLRRCHTTIRQLLQMLPYCSISQLFLPALILITASWPHFYLPTLDLTPLLRNCTTQCVVIVPKNFVFLQFKSVFINCSSIRVQVMRQCAIALMGAPAAAAVTKAKTLPQPSSSSRLPSTSSSRKLINS